MNAAPYGKPRGVLSRWWRVSLRAQGVAVLAVPMAALFVALAATGATAPTDGITGHRLTSAGSPA